MYRAFQYVIANEGVDKENSYSYIAKVSCYLLYYLYCICSCIYNHCKQYINVVKLSLLLHKWKDLKSLP